MKKERDGYRSFSNAFDLLVKANKVSEELKMLGYTLAVDGLKRFGELMDSGSVRINELIKDLERQKTELGGSLASATFKDIDVERTAEILEDWKGSMVDLLQKLGNL